MTRPGRGLIVVLAVVAVAAIPGAALAAGPHDRAAEPQLVARAVLPADTLAEGPPSGSSLGTAPINGRTPPFPGQLVQGFSALIGGGQPGVYLALADNGFGAKRRFRNWTADYFTDAPGNAIGDLTAASRDVLLLIERDNLQGAEAATKRIYELEINHLRGHAIPRTLLVDLLRIANPHLIGSPSQPGTVGLGDPFAFPFQTIESVFVLNRRTLIVANDNNYPFSAGRRPGQPDDNELIQVRLPRALPSS